MKNRINLLPTDLRGASSASKLSKTISKILVILTVILIVLGVASGGYMFFLTKQFEAVQANASEITGKITALGPAEQQFTLVRDRVDKLKPFITKKSTGDSLGLLKDLIAQFPTTIKINEVQVDENHLEFAINATASSDLVSVFSTVSSDELFSDVFLENFGYNATLGYSATLKMTIK